MKSFVPLALLASSVLAKTDIEGCTSFTSMVTARPEPGYTYQTVIWYVPDTLEICEGVDCGGGRAPPKSVPGCPLYEGPETVTPKFLDEDPMKPTESPERDIATATSPETSTEFAETETTSVESGTKTETETIATATASDVSSETRGIATTTAPDTSTMTTTMTSMITSSATTGESQSTTEGGEDAEATTTSGTDTPGAAMPTAAVAFNVVAGVAAAVAFL